MPPQNLPIRLAVPGAGELTLTESMRARLGGGIVASKQATFAWEYMVELRKEVVAMQGLRNQAIGFKITFVGTVLAVFLSTNAPRELAIIAGFAAVFFDLLARTYSISIRRTGEYIRRFLEPVIKDRLHLQSNFWMWEGFMKATRSENVSKWHHLGVTVLAAAPGVYAMAIRREWWAQVTLLALGLAFTFDVTVFHREPKFEQAAPDFEYKPPTRTAASTIPSGAS